MRGLLISAVLLALLSAPIVAEDQSPQAMAEQALLQAAFNGNLEAVQELVSKGISPNATDSEQHTPLMWAAFNGHTPVIRYLLEKGANIEAKDESGRSALMYASSGPYAETVEFLLDHGAEVNVQGTLEGFTALMTAAAEGQLEVVRLLLGHGADLALKDKDGDTAESFARQKGHTAVVELLKNPPPPAADKN